MERLITADDKEKPASKASLLVKSRATRGRSAKGYIFAEKAIPSDKPARKFLSLKVNLIESKVKNSSIRSQL